MFVRYKNQLVKIEDCIEINLKDHHSKGSGMVPSTKVGMKIVISHRYGESEIRFSNDDVALKAFEKLNEKLIKSDIEVYRIDQ